MSDALFSILFFLPIAILAIVLTPFSRGSIEAKRAHLIHNLICKIKLDRKKPFMLGSDKHHICL
ncbi:hypothetical protein ACEE73_10845, partial [Streptococcus thoraltensis]